MAKSACWRMKITRMCRGVGKKGGSAKEKVTEVQEPNEMQSVTG